MRRGARRSLTALVAALSLFGALGALAPAAGAGSARPTNLGVIGNEFSLVLTRSTVDAGPSLVQFQNRGMDPHDLVWQRVGSDRAPKTVGVITPGEQSGRTPTRFRAASQYRFWCTLGDHRQRGMKATLRVRR